MIDAFEEYEQEYRELFVNINRKCLSAPFFLISFLLFLCDFFFVDFVYFNILLSVMIVELKQAEISEMKSGLHDADLLIRKMEIEARCWQSMIVAKLKEYESDLSNQRRGVSSLDQAADGIMTPPIMRCACMRVYRLLVRGKSIFFRVHECGDADADYTDMQIDGDDESCCETVVIDSQKDHVNVKVICPCKEELLMVFGAPGSRSSPLALAAAAHPLVASISCFDERSLVVHAVGYGRGAHKPAVLVITSSGTAVSNLFPAVVEARPAKTLYLFCYSQQIVLPELHDVGANQSSNECLLLFCDHATLKKPPGSKCDATQLFLATIYITKKGYFHDVQ